MSPTPGLRRTFRATVLNPVSPERVDMYRPGYLTLNGPNIENLTLEPPETELVVMDDNIIIPGLIDAHVHLPQLGILGLGAGELLEWLERYTYPEEARFADSSYAMGISESFFDALIANGTTTASIYSSVHEAATDAAFAAAKVKGLRAFIGKAMMDRNAPARLLEDTTESLEASVRLFEKWDGLDHGRLRYVFSPRYAGSCSMTLMEEVAKFATDNDARIQSHLSENRGEVDWVQSLFPEFPSYTAVYAAAGLLGPRSVMGHCIHVDDTEMSWLSGTRTSVAFCPCSNRTLKSGVMPYARLREKGLTIGLGSDIAGGPTLSMFRQMGEALNIGLTASAAFYHATLGGAAALGINSLVGSLDPGKDADFVVLQPKYFGTYNELEHVLSRMCYLGDRDIVESVWVRGKELYKAPA